MSEAAAARPVNDHSFERFLGEEKLMGARCRSCGSLFVPPRALCPDCYGTGMEWERMQGTGTLAGFTSIAIGPRFMSEEGYGRDNPYCTGVVELREGARVVARIEGVDPRAPEGLAVGMPVKVKFLHRGGPEGARTFLAFEPA